MMINRIENKCFGCGVCKDVCPHHAISLLKNKEGFKYPHINNAICTQCQACEKVCPAIDVPVGKLSLRSLAAYSKDKTEGSSSGGVFAVIARYVLEQDGVVYGAAYNNWTLIHQRIQNIDNLSQLCGSKYVQSSCEDIYHKVQDDLLENRIVLFAGTPCQIAALSKYLHREYDNLLLIDLICHGVPSPGIFEDYLAFCGKLRHKRVKNFLFRDNRAGWNDRFCSTLIFNNGKEEYNSMLSNLWNRIFFSELATRKSCELCPFARRTRYGDITIGDFWGIENVNKQMYNPDGVSLVLINTNKGKMIINIIKNNITFAEAETTEKEHPTLFHPMPQNPQRDTFMNDYSSKGFSYIADKYFGYNRVLDFKLYLHKILTRNNGQ